MHGAAPVNDRLRRAAEFFVRMVHPLEPWDYGDSDDAQVLPIVLDRGDAMAEWQSWLAGYDHGDIIGYWMGESPLRNVPLDSSTTPEGWWLAPDTGMAVCEMEDWVLRLDASPTGFGKIAAHGHCDALHLSIWDGTQALVIDPGTFGYYGMGDRRADLAAWTAHNGPQPSHGFKTPRRMGTFLLTQHHRKPWTHRIGECHIMAELNHEGHEVKREVNVTTNGVLVVEDLSVSTEAIRVKWVLAPECSVTGGAGLVYQIKRGAKVWHVEFCGDDLVTVEMGEMMVSRRYGQLERAMTIEVVAKGELRTEWKRG
jgi:hypothetical protein